MTRIKAGALPGSAGWPRQRRGSARVRHGLGMARMLMLATAATLAVALVLPAAGGASPPTGGAGGSIAGAPPGAVAGSLSAGGPQLRRQYRRHARLLGSTTPARPRRRPAASPPSPPATAHSCGLRTDGTLACWGDNDFGPGHAPDRQLHRRQRRRLPQLRRQDRRHARLLGLQRRRPGLAARRHASPPSAPATHSCGVRTDGTLACWGAQLDGQATPPAGSFSAVSAGDFHSCGAQDRRHARLLGQQRARPGLAARRQLQRRQRRRRHSCGAAGPTARSPAGATTATGQATPPAGSFSAVSAGGAHSCGVRTDGTLACWGSNVDGQASPPAGTFSRRSAPAASTAAASGPTARSPAGATTTTGRPRRPPAASAPSAPARTTAAALRTRRHARLLGPQRLRPGLAARRQLHRRQRRRLHSCGLRTDGTLACWGRNGIGQATPPAGSFTAVSAGVEPQLRPAGRDGTLACWGDNGFGQASPPAGTFSAVSAGGFATAAALRTDGTLACWGRNVNGQATPPDRQLQRRQRRRLPQLRPAGPTARSPAGAATATAQASPPAGSFSAVSAGGFHSCGLQDRRHARLLGLQQRRPARGRAGDAGPGACPRRRSSVWPTATHSARRAAFRRRASPSRRGACRTAWR